MPEGGGLATANAFATTAPRDGSVIAIVQRSVPQLAIQGDPETKFDPLAFNWLGSLSSFSHDASMIVIKATHPAMTTTDLRKTGIAARLGSDGPGTTQYLFAVIAKKVLGLNISVVPTYPGSVSIFEDMDAGKLDGQVIGLNSIRASQPGLWAAKTLRPLVQFGRTTRHPDLADVPTMRELTTYPKAQAIIEFAEQPFLMALPFMAPPGVPADRAAALREAFALMMADDDFLADARNQRLDITPSPVRPYALSLRIWRRRREMSSRNSMRSRCRRGTDARRLSGPAKSSKGLFHSGSSRGC
jgi:tripartite-type tricarboxylate transporter receptor subunit TctC